MARGTGLAKAAAALAIMAATSCVQAPPASAILDPGKVSSIVVGRSSRTDVFTALGRPTRTQQGLAGESWVYDAKTDDSGRQRLMSGAAAASGVAGAFVPYLGLVGSGLGLANASADTGQRAPDMVSMTVDFGANGLVRDCTYSSSAVPAGMPGAAAGAATPLGCQRPYPATPSRS
jgi:outer membrane protein assembly factor BamE (lipoprotein component of BamABCDE complex)